MSFLNHRDIKTFHVIFLITFIQYLPSVLGGMCWSQMAKKGYCKEILKSNISREQCCDDNDGSYAYSTENLTDAALFFWRALSDGVPCTACKETCDSVQCGSDKKCVIKKGHPTCICAPKCKHQKNAIKGAVCGTDGRSYKSVCRMKKRACRTKNHSLNINYYGLCQSSCKNVQCSSGKYCIQDQNLNAHCVKCNYFCSYQSPSTFRRVCGIDNITYRSICHLREASCQNGRAIPVAYEGKCKSNATCKNIRCPYGQKCLINKTTHLPRCVSCSECPKWKSVATVQKEMGGPICGTNNKTYDSWCYMVEDSCRLGYVVETQFAESCETGNKLTDSLDNSVLSQ